MTRGRWLAACLVCTGPSIGFAADPGDRYAAHFLVNEFYEPLDLPAIRDIAYEGNDVTRPVTMDRELVIAVGRPAGPVAIQRSRQAVQDLGLFREVKVRQEPVEGGVRVVFTVREKWYVLPVPRLEANSDGDTTYGLVLHWNNLWGLNHRLDVYALRHDYQRDDRDNSNNYSVSYNIPFLDRDSRTALNLSAAHSRQNSTSEDDVNYRERTERLGVTVSRAFNEGGPKSQGWKAGGGLMFQEQHASGPDEAPASFGTAVGPTASVSYNDVHDHIYSQTGRSFTSSLSFAVEDAGSDYGYFQHFSYYSYEQAVGKREHQTLRTTLEAGGYYGGPDSKEKKTFEYGGSERLRGYDREKIEGNVAYAGSIDFLTPLHWKWLRLLTTFEAGSALDSLHHPHAKPLYASLGLGVTVRVTWLVNVELEAGIAYPLIDGDGLRFFARSI